MGKKKQRNNNTAKSSSSSNSKTTKAASKKGGGGTSTPPLPQQQPPVVVVGNNRNNGATTDNQVGPGRLVIQILMAVVKVTVVMIVTFPFWLAVHSLVVVYGRPPNLVYWKQTIRFLTYTWTVPLLSLSERIRLSTVIVVHTLWSSAGGMAWLLDELLYGRQLHGNNDSGNQITNDMKAPLFVVSGYRSASTQMGRCLVAASASTTAASAAASSQSQSQSSSVPHFVAPNSLMVAWPYLWLWYLVSYIVGDLPEEIENENDDTNESGLSKKDIRRYLNKNFPPEFLARHDNDPFQLDTIDGPFLSCHLNGLA